jgi:hypothetical protein
MTTTELTAVTDRYQLCVDTILAGWHEDTTSPIPQHPAGSAGPPEADALLDGGRR